MSGLRFLIIVDNSYIVCPTGETAIRRNLKKFGRIKKKSVYLQHNNVMPKGNEFNELGVQPSLNAFFFSLKDPKAEGCSSTRSAVFFTELNITLL